VPGLAVWRGRVAARREWDGREERRTWHWLPPTTPTTLHLPTTPAMNFISCFWCSSLRSCRCCRNARLSAITAICCRCSIISRFNVLFSVSSFTSCECRPPPTKLALENAKAVVRGIHDTLKGKGVPPWWGARAAA
jgi:hypothetical protein